ncbi:MAG: hypothetical protein ACK4IX_01735, partial [Candidatus Sericytochromatia bacterium]
RVLCKLAEKFIVSKYDPKLEIKSSYMKLKNFLLKGLSELNLKLANETYYSTLLVFITSEKHTDIFIFGDGYLKIKYSNKKIVKSFKYSKNAPYYLAYDLNESDKKMYFDTFKQVLEINSTEIINEEKNTQKSIKEIKENIFYRLENENLISVSIMSDGIESFQDSNKKEINDLEIVEELTNYKNTNGNFVIRRNKAFLRDCNKKEITHKDDLSIASIFIEKFSD